MSQGGEGNPTTSVDEADIDTIELVLRPEEFARLEAFDVMSRAQASNEQVAPRSVDPIPELPASVSQADPPTPVPVAPSFAEVPAPVVLQQAEPAARVTIVPTALPEPPPLPPLVPPAPEAVRVEVLPIPESRPQPSAPLDARRTPLSVETFGHSERRQQARWPWITLSAVAAALVLILYWLFSLDTHHANAAPVSEPMTPAAPPEPTPVVTPVAVAVEAPAPRPQPAPSGGEIVRFRNPFDWREIFEFPAGTTRTEARDAVAEILLERARERQASPAARSRKPAGSEQPNGAGDLVENSARAAN